ncbi:hypothetical protein FDH82_gp08 [Roseobacter phage RDJL Phi 2]|uniref:Uncharacterized protein n=1 Tax=Roseobacter phage RDJL Phi 2 TaxID=1682380 RepID=A0A0K0PWK8_9CAUD|nr:hypothetical protein FDH82_gp08 [Roseobacter phage RDJL Phi 2]AKQ75798.1 hypothetical protein RDJLphi2_gp08 [Roseobacter phage RDJL Phi 2]
MTYDEMIEKTNAQLVDYHNELAAQCGANDLKAWKNAKTKLIERIEWLQAQIEDAAIDAEDDELTSVTVNSETFEQTDEPLDEPAGEPIPAEEIEDEDPEGDGSLDDALSDEDTDEEEPKRTIKAASVDLLCHVAYYENRDEKSSDDNRVEADDPKARSVGLAYDEIIARIQEEFPGCNTSVACLRWYSVKIRVEEHGYEGLKLPQRRPRAKPKTAG